MREWISLNGRLMPADQALVSALDSGFMQGVGLFETMRAYEGSVFRLERHLDRLRSSAARLHWTELPDEDELRDNVLQVLGALEQSEARVRLTVTTGSLRSRETERPALTIVVSATPTQDYPPEIYLRGVSLAVCPFRQSAADPTVGHKTTSYYARLCGLRHAHAMGLFESIWLSEDGRLAEGSISNLFIVRDGELLTPTLDTPVLPGVTRAAVLELAASLRLTARECALALDDLRAADEAFLTNSMMQIVPVVRLEREPIGAEKPGEITARLFDAYQTLVDRECGHA